MGRGPSYPYLGLEDAIGYARRMYDYAKRGSAPVDSVITEAWKYSATSSSSVKIVAALKAFGLVEDAPGTNGKALKLTSRSIRILLDDQDSSERREEIRKAALAPKWYEYCWKTWGKELPPSMKSNLLIEHGFVDSTVELFLKDYRKTIAFAGLMDNLIFPDEPESAPSDAKVLGVGDYVQWEMQGVLKMPEAKRIGSFLDGGKFALLEGSFNPVPVAQLIAAQPPEQSPAPLSLFSPAPTRPLMSGEKNMQSETIALADGLTLHVQWPSIISEDAYDDFLYQLEGFKRRIGRAVQKAGASTDAAGSELKSE